MMGDLLDFKLDKVPFDQVIQQIKQGIMITDLAGRILFVNTAFCEATGYSPDEIIGKTRDILKSKMHGESFYKLIQATLDKTDCWQGEIYNRNKAGEIYLQWLDINVMKDDKGNITRFVYSFTDMHKHKEAQNEIVFLAYHDSLTKLPNRVYAQQYLHDLLHKTKEPKQLVAVLYLDLDRFKQINDTLGHAFGDELLRQAAERMEAVLRKSDMVSRVGGDEFICILSDITEKREAEIVAEKIIRTLSRPFHLKNMDCYISASVGISFYPYDGDDIDTLVTYADTAMYRAKNNGKNQYKLARVEENAGAFEILVFENALRKALEEKSFTLNYQPLMDMKTHHVNGFEALIRWEHPDFGNVSPADFIPLAEDTGLIIPIGEWVLRTAVRQNMAWQKEGIPPVRMAVNISAYQFLDNNFLNTVFRILNETGMPAHLLELEITETVLMQQTAAATSILAQLRNKGIRISIDDFGTGYSSLNYIKNFPVDTLKIDKSFIQDMDANPNNKAIITAVTTLAHDLNLKVIGEGVETTQQLLTLNEPECDEIQGYLFSKPIPGNKVNQWLKQQNLDEEKMESLRKELIAMAKRKGFNHPDTIHASQKLDVYMNESRTIRSGL